MNKSFATLILGLGILGTALAEDATRASFGDSEMIAGGDVVVDEPVDGNSFAAGGRVEIRERISGNAYVSGGDVTIAGSVGRSLYAAGGEVRLEGEVEGRARVAGGTIRMARGARIGRDASFAGGSIEVDGAIGDRLRAYGERIVINGSVDGDVETAGESIRIGPDARISGRVLYRSRDRIQIDPAAEVTGGVVQTRSDREWLRKLGKGATIVGGIFVSLGMLLLGALLILGMPRFSREAGAMIRRKPWQSLGLGCLMLLAVPILIVILTITLVGIPLALLLVFGYVAILLLGFLVAAIFLGDLALERVAAGKMSSVWWRALFLLLALVVIAIVKQVPVIGDLAWWVLFLAGLGAFTLRAWQGFRQDDIEPAAVSR